MPIKSEVLNKGLRNLIDPALATEGSLLRADNARYRPGDPAVWQAEGRRQVGDGGHGAANFINSMAGIQWDPGTVKQTGIAELEQILYRVPWSTETESGDLQTIPAYDDPSNALMNAANSTKYAFQKNALGQPDVYMGNWPMRTVQFENAHYILTGGDNVRMKRTAGGSQTVSRHGMQDSSDVKVYCTDIAGSGTLAKGTHFYWFTWYDSVNDIEGGANSYAVLDSLTAPYLGWVTSATDQTSRDVRLDFEKIYFDDSPISADKVRIYKTPVSAFTPTLIAPISQWPHGYRIAEVSVAEIKALATRSFFVNGTTIVIAYPYTLSFSDEENITEYIGYDAVQINVGGLPAAQVPLYGEPPNASTGDVFEESLLLNDRNDVRKVRFSFPGKAGAFPATYFINFETDKTDQVWNIRSLGNVAGIFLGNSIWRLNWLPNKSDFDFARGRVKDVVSETIGTLGPASVARFDWPGKGPSLATVDRTGVYVTDLYSTKELSEHLDWDAIVATGELTPNTALLNNSDQRRLELYLGEDIYYFHYDDAHRDEQGDLAITGPIKRVGKVRAAAEIITNVGTKRTVTSDNNGAPYSLYYEGIGFLEEAENIAGVPTANSYLAFNVVTREVYPFGPGNEGITQKLMAHIKPSGQGGNIVAHLTTGFGNPTITKTSKPIPASTRQLILATMMALHEYYKVQFSGVIDESGAAMAINFISVQAEGLGETQSSRF